MLRMIDYNAAKQRLRISGSDYTNNREVWKKWAIANGADQTPFLPGQIFGEWVDNRLVPAEALTLMYIITIDPDNGESTYTIKVPAGQTPNPTTPTRSGYIFDGWFPTIVPATADATYKAQWTPDVVYYTISFLKSDGVTTAYPSVQYAAGTRVTSSMIPSQGSESDNYAATLVNPDPDLYYTPTGWLTSTGRIFGTLIRVIDGNYTFISTFGADSRNDGNIKIFDQIGQLLNTTKTKPATSSTGDVGRFQSQSSTGWFSMVHDGHSDSESNGDVLGADKGISPTEAKRQQVLTAASRPYSARHSITLTESGQSNTYYGYTGDSVVYEPLNLTTGSYQAYRESLAHTISTLPVSASSVTANDLIDEIVFYNANHDEILRIKSNADWIKFAVIDVRGSLTSTNFFDMATYDPTQTPQYITVPVDLQVEVVYYIKDNTSNNARCGQVEVTTAGGDCSLVLNQPGTPFDTTNNKYMTKGTVFFYQLGQNYTGS